MANTFRLVNNAVMPSSTGTPDALYTAGSGKTAIVLGLTLANVHTSQVTATVTVTDTSASITSHIVKDIPIPVGSSIEIMSGNKIVVEASDIVKVDCSVSDKVSATLSIMEIDV
mgnify:FL=1|jgi:hypothetical protein|tara:strand:- start:47 stop:388 length:342 start_codon:yes stop_codon:yes gene_type:complete